MAVLLSFAVHWANGVALIILLPGGERVTRPPDGRGCQHGSRARTGRPPRTTSPGWTRTSRCGSAARDSSVREPSMIMPSLAPRTNRWPGRTRHELAVMTLDLKSCEADRLSPGRRGGRVDPPRRPGGLVDISAATRRPPGTSGLTARLVAERHLTAPHHDRGLMASVRAWRLDRTL